MNNYSKEHKKEDLDEKDLYEEKVQVSDEEFEKFQSVLSRDLVLELYSIFKMFEKKGLITYKIYMESMTQLFNKYNKDKTNDFTEIFDLIFNRFQKIKCIMKNDKKVFYLTNMVPQNKIETYIIVCFLTIFIKCRIIDKIKLLFELSDIDDDGFLNKNEIKHMISTINFMFSEENSLINTNSSILAQSLMNIKVKEKINKIMIDPGNLDAELEKEKYINFDIFYNSLIKIKNYKYEIIPFFINMKQCLYNKRSEKILEVKDKYKKEFIRATSALSSDKLFNPFKKFKRNFSANNLGRIIKNVKVNNENNLRNNKKKNLLFGIKEKNKSFKDLLKESTIFSDEENGEEKSGDGRQNSIEELFTSSASKRVSPFNTTKNKPFYIFEADFDKIKKIEVEPALLKFSKNYENNSKDFLNKKNFKNHAALSGKSRDLASQKKHFFYRRNQNHMSNKDLNKINIFNFKNNDLVKSSKRASLLSMKNNNNLYNNYLFKEKQAFNLFNTVFNSSNASKILDNSKVGHTLSKTTLKNFNSININTNYMKKKSISKKKNNRQFSFTKTKKKKMISNIKNRNSSKSNIIENKNIKKFINLNHKLNRFKYKQKKYNQIFNENNNKNKNEANKRINKYLSVNEIFKDVDKNEEKLRHERTEYFGKELIALYKKMIKEKKEIRSIIGKYDKYDISLNFFDFKKKAFPKDFGKSIFSYNKYN